MYERVRLTPEERKREIVNAGLVDASERGPYGISFKTVLERLENCKEGTVRHYYPVFSMLRNAIIAEALVTNNHFVIGGALEMRNSLTYHLSPYMRDKCMDAFSNRGGNV